jgi:hypothetical protein
MIQLGQLSGAAADGAVALILACIVMITLSASGVNLASTAMRNLARCVIRNPAGDASVFFGGEVATLRRCSRKRQ